LTLSTIFALEKWKQGKRRERDEGQARKVIEGGFKFGRVANAN